MTQRFLTSDHLYRSLDTRFPFTIFEAALNHAEHTLARIVLAPELTVQGPQTRTAIEGELDHHQYSSMSLRPSRVSGF